MTCHNIFLASKTLRKLYREYYRYMYLMLILDLVDNCLKKKTDSLHSHPRKQTVQQG